MNSNGQSIELKTMLSKYHLSLKIKRRLLLSNQCKRSLETLTSTLVIFPLQKLSITQGNDHPCLLKKVPSNLKVKFNSFSPIAQHYNSQVCPYHPKHYHPRPLRGQYLGPNDALRPSIVVTFSTRLQQRRRHFLLLTAEESSSIFQSKEKMHPRHQEPTTTAIKW